MRDCADLCFAPSASRATTCCNWSLDKLCARVQGTRERPMTAASHRRYGDRYFSTMFLQATGREDL